MAFNNRIRLPFKITRPQFSEERGSFRKANGATKTMFVTIKKSYEGETDWLPEKWHERLKIALAHDNVVIEGGKYLGGVNQEGDYDINWQEFLDYPTAKAKFKVNVTPFAASNTNCQTCEEATQLNVVNDTFEDSYGDPLDLAEDTEYILNVADNDEICCYPVQFSITSFNSSVLVSATIDNDGILTIRTKTPLQDATNVLLVTYRVTCPNGSYDEANVYGNINGSIAAACLAPENVTSLAVTNNSAEITWDAPTPAPVNGYIWQLFRMDTPGTPVQEGATTDLFVNLTGLEDGTDYGFYVKSDCDTDESAFVEELFTTTDTPPGSGFGCGEYSLFNNDLNMTEYQEVTYMDCFGNYQTIRVYGQGTPTICAAQNSPGDPVYIYVHPIIHGGNKIGQFAPPDSIEINYIDLC